MTKAELEKLAEKYEEKAEKNYRNYQGSGIARYDREYRHNDEIASALRVAANAAVEHHAYVEMKGQMANFAATAQSLKFVGPARREASVESLIRDIIAYGKLMGLLRDI